MRTLSHTQIHTYFIASHRSSQSIVQERIFRLQPEVMKFIYEEASTLDKGKGFPGIKLSSTSTSTSISTSQSPLDYHYYLSKKRPIGPGPIAGLHVRHGDKHTDGFKHHSLDMQIYAVKHSDECLSLPAEYAAKHHHETDVIEGTKSGCWAVGGEYPSGHLMPIYVASDDPNVLAAASKMGHLVDTEGVSHKTAGTYKYKFILLFLLVNLHFQPIDL